MPATQKTDETSRLRRRADAERSIERILDAAVDAFGENSDANMAEIARRARVVRATIYVHFPTRAALIDAVTSRAMTEAIGLIEVAEPERGEPDEALRRVVAASWRSLGRYHPLVALNVSTHAPEQLHAKHGSLLDRLRPLIERGQRAGSFDTDVPADWHLAMIMAIIHTASCELNEGRIADDVAARALVTSVLGAVRMPVPTRRQPAE